MVAGAPRIDSGPAGLPGVRPRQRPRRAQRAVRHRLPQGRGAPRTGHDVAAASRSSTPPTWPASCVTRDEVPNRKLATLAQLFRRRPRPPTTGPCTTRGRPSTCCTALLERVGNLGRRHPRGARDASPPGSRRSPAPQAPPRRRAAVRAGGLPLPGPPRPGRSTSARPATSGARVRTYFTASEQRTRMAEMVRHRRAGRRRSSAHTTLEAEVRELRLIAEHKPRYNRRSRFPERALWVKLTVEPFPRLSHRARGPRRRRARTSGRSARGRRPSRRSTAAARGACRCASAPSGCRRAGRGPRAARWPRWAAAARRAPGRQTRRGLRRPWSPRRRGCSAATPATVVAALRERIGLLAGQERFEDAARRPRPDAAPGPRPPPGPSGWRRSPPSPSSSPPAGAPTAAGRSSASGTAGSPAPATSPRRRRPDALRRRRCAPRAEVVAPPGRSAAGGHARGDRDGAALARGAGRPARRRSRASGPARCTAPAPRGPGSSPWPRRRAASSASTSAARTGSAAAHRAGR